MPPSAPEAMPPGREPRSRDLNLSQLHTFRLVMEQGGYAAAARVSYLSVPSVWQHIQAIERAYGVCLFTKHGRQVAPTDAARKLYEQIEPILEHLESTFVLVNDAPTNTIRFVSGARMMLEDLAAPLAQFHQRYPNHLVLRHGNDRRAEELILSNEADLAATLEPDLRYMSRSIHYEPAYSVEFLAVSSKQHPYAKAKSSRLSELAKHDLIVTGSGTHGREALDEAFHHAGLNANVVIETDNSAFTLACVSAGMGVGILAGRKQGNLCQELASRSLSRQLGRRRIVLMYRKGRALTEPMSAIIESIQALDST